MKRSEEYIQMRVTVDSETMNYNFDAASLFLGAILAVIVGMVTALISRRTHASNNLSEKRLEALDSVWSAYSEVMFYFGMSKWQGRDSWLNPSNGPAENRGLRVKDLAKAINAHSDFVREIHRTQILLDQSVTDAFYAIDQALTAYRKPNLVEDKLYWENKGYPESYDDLVECHLRPHLKQLAKAVNETLNTRTHVVSIRFADPSSHSASSV